MPSPDYRFNYRSEAFRTASKLNQPDTKGCAVCAP